MICVTILAFPRFWKMLRLSDRLYCVREDSCRTGDGSLLGLFVPYRSWQIFVFPVSAVWANRGNLRFILPQQAYPAKTSKRPHNGADAQRTTRIALACTGQHAAGVRRAGCYCNSNVQQRASLARAKRRAVSFGARGIQQRIYMEGAVRQRIELIYTGQRAADVRRAGAYCNSNGQWRTAHTCKTTHRWFWCEGLQTTARCTQRRKRRQGSARKSTRYFTARRARRSA